jgi:hypothetical protein
MLLRNGYDTKGKHVVVVDARRSWAGQSRFCCCAMGAAMLLSQSRQRTRNPAEITRQADIPIAPLEKSN